jgi:hypothetical protein
MSANLTPAALLNLAAEALAARGLDFDGEASIGLAFAGDVVVLGVEGGDTLDPHEECAPLAMVSDLEDALRRALWSATRRDEPLVLRA